MTELVEYHQYQCERCGFRTRSPDEDETVDIAQRHESDKHDADRTREEISGELRLLELEGLPDNS
jgi:predicted small metal-binding protein